jgi:Outer membrane protein beta-barrel domain
MKLWPVVFLTCACAAVSPAQVGEVSLNFGWAVMKDNILGIAADLSGTQYTINNGFNLAARMTLNTRKYVGHEFGYAYSRTKLGATGFSGSQELSTHQGFYDFLLYALPEGSRIRPFLAGGAQFTTFVPPGASAAYGQGTTKYGGNFGAGVKLKINSMFLVRLDARDYVTTKPFNLINQSGALHQIEVTAGLGLMF